jgi:hypothetical protein
VGLQIKLTMLNKAFSIQSIAVRYYLFVAQERTVYVALPILTKQDRSFIVTPENLSKTGYYTPAHTPAHTPVFSVGLENRQYKRIFQLRVQPPPAIIS